jgi:hypothetical protein
MHCALLLSVTVNMAYSLQLMLLATETDTMRLLQLQQNLQLMLTTMNKTVTETTTVAAPTKLAMTRIKPAVLQNFSQSQRQRNFTALYHETGSMGIQAEDLCHALAVFYSLGCLRE